MAAPPVQRPAAVPGWAAMPAPRASAWHPAFYLAIVYIIFTYTRFAEIFAMVTHKGVRLALVSVFLLAGCIDGFEQCSKAMYAMAISVIVIEAFGFFLGNTAVQAEGRFGLEQGTFANPNDLATLLLMGLPGCLLVVRTRRGLSLLKVLCFGALFLIPVTVVRTGSRGGLLALIAMFLVYWLSVPALRKLQVGVGAVVVIAASLIFANTDALYRYKAIFVSSSQTTFQSEAEASAVESTMGRKELFWRSVRMTFEHPLLGVGPGMFQDADAKNASEDNYNAYWRQTHNSFTQISSEEGLPALLFYCAAIFFCFRATRAAGKLAGADESRRWIKDLAFTLGLSLLAFVITGIFASNAYNFYFPFVAGLCAALERAVAAERKLVVV